MYVYLIMTKRTVITTTTVTTVKEYDDDDEIIKDPIEEIKLPGDVLDLDDWKLTLPLGFEEKVVEVFPPFLKTYSNFKYFNLKDNGVLMTTYADGFTTKNSSYPRTEFREMKNNKEFDWDSNFGKHEMKCTFSILNIPKVKPEVCVLQIHDTEDDVLQIRLENKKLMIASPNYNKIIDQDYLLGTKISINIVVEQNRVAVFYKGQQYFYKYFGKKNYFKAGMYLQSNLEKGDLPTSFGQMIIYELNVSHQ